MHFCTPARQPREREELEALLPAQRAAVNFVLSQSQGLSNGAMGDVQERMIALGYSAADLSRCLRYLRDEAPVRDGGTVKP